MNIPLSSQAMNLFRELSAKERDGQCPAPDSHDSVNLQELRQRGLLRELSLTDLGKAFARSISR